MEEGSAVVLFDMTGVVVVGIFTSLGRGKKRWSRNDTESQLVDARYLESKLQDPASRLNHPFPLNQTN